MKKTILILSILLFPLFVVSAQSLPLPEELSSWNRAIEYTQPEENLLVYSKDGRIVVEGSYTYFRVFNILGKEVPNENLIRGIYIVRVVTENSVRAFKIIVE